MQNKTAQGLGGYYNSKVFTMICKVLCRRVIAIRERTELKKDHHQSKKPLEGRAPGLEKGRKKLKQTSPHQTLLKEREN